MDLINRLWLRQVFAPIREGFLFLEFSPFSFGNFDENF
jgi:hypothetical protein